MNATIAIITIIIRAMVTATAIIIVVIATILSEVSSSCYSSELKSLDLTAFATSLSPYHSLFNFSLTYRGLSYFIFMYLYS